MTEAFPAALQTAVGDRYELRRLLGRGGMASVYLAYDRKHQREVAIKVLLPDLAAAIGSERFLAEIQIVARLNHPHILGMHDSGQAEGFLYYVMPFVEGGSLRQQLHPGRLELRDALAIAQPVADALAYAHRMHVLHRDIKPENILFSQGFPIVADFGIAKAVSTAAGEVNLTRTGFPLGTPGYMSPEQAAGLTDLDERTDVYSLAVVIYEMLVGEVPGRWPTEDAVRAGRFLEAAPTHRSRLTDLGDRIEAALTHATAIRLDQRTATPRGLLDELTGTGPLSAPVPAPRRRYSGDEVQEIVKRATELEASNTTAGGAMTIGGVAALAGEVGIAPELVRSAARSVTTRSAPETAPLVSPARNPWIGGPTRLVYDRVVEGALSEDDFPVIVDEIRRRTGNVGQAGTLGPTLTWSMTRGLGGGRRDLEVMLAVRRGRTRITVQESLGQLIGMVFGPIGGGMGGGGFGVIFAALMSANLPVLLPVVIPAWLAGTYLTARTVYRESAKRRDRELAGLADSIAALVRELIAERPLLP